MESLFKKKDKEKIDFPLFGASSSQDSPNIFDPEWEVNVGRSLLKTKSESDLKNTEFNSRRLNLICLILFGEIYNRLRKLKHLPFKTLKSLQFL